MSDAGTPVVDSNPAAAARKEQEAKDLERAKEAGWHETILTQYVAGDGSAVEPDETHEAASWLSDAAVYEWDDEYGDVGPVNPALEQQLYLDPTIQRAGQGIKALEFKVEVIGPKVLPVRDVRFDHSHLPFITDMTSVQRCWPTSHHARERQVVPVSDPNSNPVLHHSCRSDWQRCGGYCSDW